LSCRAKEVLVIFTTNDPIAMHFSWAPRKRAGGPLGQSEDLEAWEIAEEIKPLPSELRIRKMKASAFFLASLNLHLAQPQIRLLVIRWYNHLRLFACFGGGCVFLQVSLLCGEGMYV